ncbi:hypothetical protein [Cronobacter universalis]|uniref:hypothetical protein n=1 Tax=Cronobacter universalis TaxID=535744 RepID=UPI003CF1955C
MTQACSSITQFDKIRLFHNIISARRKADHLHKNSSQCIIMLFIGLYTGDICVAPQNKKN